MSQFLQFGYIGFLALLIVLCCKIILAERSQGKPLLHTIAITLIFSLISAAGGVSGYLWSSKELEVEQTQLSAIQAKNLQIEEARKRHIETTKAIRKAQSEALESFNSYALDSSRSEKLKEAERLNKMLSYREDDYQAELNAIAKSFKGK